MNASAACGAGEPAARRFEAEFAHWLIRPSQADPAVTLPIGLPNHPSCPSAHSCISRAFGAVLADAFPSEQRGRSSRSE